MAQQNLTPGEIEFARRQAGADQEQLAAQERALFIQAQTERAPLFGAALAAFISPAEQLAKKVGLKKGRSKAGTLPLKEGFRGFLKGLDARDKAINDLLTERVKRLREGFLSKLNSTFQR